MPDVDDKQMTDRELAERGKVRLPDGTVGTQLQGRLYGHENLVGVADHPMAIRYDQPVFPSPVAGAQQVEIVVVEGKESGFDEQVVGPGAQDEEPPTQQPRAAARGRR